MKTHTIEFVEECSCGVTKCDAEPKAEAQQQRPKKNKKKKKKGLWAKAKGAAGRLWG